MAIVGTKEKVIVVALESGGFALLAVPQQAIFDGDPGMKR
jgi:hypothetical protein